MDGRVNKRVGISAGILMAMAAVMPTAARAQAMGKAAVDGAGFSTPVAVAPAAPTEMPVSPAREMAKPAVPEAKPLNMTSWSSMDLMTLPKAPAAEVKLGASEKIESPTAKLTELKEPVAATGDTAPKIDTTPKPMASPIEQTAIRRSGDETPAPGAGSQQNATAVPSGWKNFVQVGGALVIVLGLIFIFKAFARKFVPGAKSTGGKGVIEILARHPLTKNQSIVLVRIGSQIVALNQGKDASESVLVISDGEEVARIIGQIEGKSPNSVSAGFNRLLANAQVDLEQSSPADDETDGKAMGGENLDEQLEEMAAAKRQLMELRQHVRTVRDSLPRT